MPRRSILVVDDESDIRLEICDYLTRKGYLCEAAENGAQAWRGLGSRARACSGSGE